MIEVSNYVNYIILLKAFFYLNLLSIIYNYFLLKGTGYIKPLLIFASMFGIVGYGLEYWHLPRVSKEETMRIVSTVYPELKITSLICDVNRPLLNGVVELSSVNPLLKSSSIVNHSLPKSVCQGDKMHISLHDIEDVLASNMAGATSLEQAQRYVATVHARADKQGIRSFLTVGS